MTSSAKSSVPQFVLIDGDHLIDLRRRFASRSRREASAITQETIMKVALIGASGQGGSRLSGRNSLTAAIR